MKLVAALLGIVLVVLTPLAHGSPIDPSTPGFWDNGDYDDVVLFLSSDLHALDTADRPVIRGHETLAEGVRPSSRGAVAQPVYEPGTPRAPPLPHAIAA